MKTEKEIMEMIVRCREYCNKYGGAIWAWETVKMLERQISILEWALDIEGEDDENKKDNRKSNQTI